MTRKLLLLFLALGFAPPAAVGRGSRVPVKTESDVQSPYSHIRVKRQGNVRMMIFVRDSGDEAIQTMMNLKKPYEMLAPYSRYMFGSYLLQPKQQQVLIVGLGGGAMVQFYQHYDPEVKVDAVEIDAEVVKAADEFFQTRTGGNTRIITDDAFHYFETNKTRYDVIYMDAFLKPSQKTDATGLPLRLKTIDFYKGLQEKLAPQGLVVINLNVHQGVDEDLATIRSAFAQTYAFRTAKLNMVVLCSSAKARETTAALRERARELDRRFKATFSFQELLGSLVRTQPGGTP